MYMYSGRQTNYNQFAYTRVQNAQNDVFIILDVNLLSTSLTISSIRYNLFQKSKQIHSVFCDVFCIFVLQEKVNFSEQVNSQKSRIKSSFIKIHNRLNRAVFCVSIINMYIMGAYKKLQISLRTQCVNKEKVCLLQVEMGSKLNWKFI